MAKDSADLARPTEEELFELIGARFPKLDREDIRTVVKRFEGLQYNEVEDILQPGVRFLKNGKRVILAYLRTSPLIYGLAGQEDFSRWLELASRTSELSVSCCEGFFDSSVLIIKKGGIFLLERWTDLGMSCSKISKWLSIAYFRYTGNVVVSTDFEYFKELVSAGRLFADANVNVAEEYFKDLPHLHSLLLAEDFRLWCSIIGDLLEVSWITAIDIISSSSEVLFQVLPHRTRTLLEALDTFAEYDKKTISALFRNSPRVMELMDDQDYTVWVNEASRIAKIDSDAAIAFLNRGPDIIASIDMEELTGWIDKALESLSTNRIALEAFIYGSFKGLGRYYGIHHLEERHGRQEREYLLDTGIRLALINPECVESYFEHSPQALKSLTKEKFDEWVQIGEEISKESPSFGNAYFRNFTDTLRKSSPTYHGELLTTARMLLDKDRQLAGIFFENLPDASGDTGPEGIRKWAGTGIKIFDQNKDLAIDYFSHSSSLLKDLNVSELEEWALNGIGVFEENPPLGRPYFSLKSKSSKEFIEELTGSAALNEVAGVLRYYALGLSGVSFNVLSRRTIQIDEEPDAINPIVAGRTIYLAPRISRYGDFGDNFKIYKLSIMHEVGHVQFSSHTIDLEDASALIADIKRRYTTRMKSTCLSGRQPLGVIDIADIIALFPNEALAGTILGILEDARVEYMIMENYKGVRSELERIRHQMLLERPAPSGKLEEFMESLLWISTGHEPVYATSKRTEELLNRAGTLLNERVLRKGSCILDCLDAAFRIYMMLDEKLGPLSQIEYKVLRNIDYRGVGIGAYGKKDPLSSRSHENIIRNFIPESEVDLTAEQERPKEEKVKRQSSYVTDRNWKLLGSYSYDEWDAVINDYKTDWCTVNEIEPLGMSSDYYKEASKNYRNEIALIKRVFNRMKPETFRRMKEQADGTEVDIDAFIDALIQKKCGINPDDRLYLRWDKHERDVATLFLIDVSYSTRKMVGYEGKSIVDVEKDSLTIMIQALESIGDKYAIYAFSGQTRDDVEYFVIKGFAEELSDTVARRISLLEPVSNTRLGPAIRHSIRKLEKIEARTKILILLSDGEPFDTSRGESAYKGSIAEEDTRVAIGEGNARGIHFFCITVDSNPGKYLDNIFSDVGYTIIDDARSLPESLPMLYKRVTT
ncbi:MAG: hypothetical protein JW705_08520 [Methanosarcinaceae archaeon]|nr:hypothetical protein [Methanosarcinaceae archaeon]